MSTIAKETETTEDFEQLKTRLQTTWMTGDYDIFSRFMEKDATQSTHKIGGSMSRRAELLADRIEEGAAGLAAFAEGLSEAEWRTPVSAYVTAVRSASSCTMLPASTLLRLISREQSPAARPLRTSRGESSPR